VSGVDANIDQVVNVNSQVVDEENRFHLEGDWIG